MTKHRYHGRGRLLWVVALLIAACLSGGSWYYLERSTTPYPGYELVKADPNSKTLVVTQVLMTDYGEWVTQVPYDNFPGEALAVWGMLHNQYVTAYKVEAGLDVAPITVANETYDQTIRPVQAALLKSGWTCAFSIPTEQVTPKGSRAIASGWLGQIVAQRTATVSRWNGETVTYPEVLVDRVLVMAAPDMGNAYSITSTGVVAHFLPAWNIQADEALVALTKPSTATAWYSLEWQHLQQTAAAQPERVHSILLNDCIASSSAHEAQHIADTEINEILSNPRYAGGPRWYLGLLLELRGMLAAIAHGPAPIYGYSHMCELTTLPEADNYYRKAAEIGAYLMSSTKPNENTQHPHQLRQALRNRARQVLEKMDAEYPQFIAIKDQTDPSQRMNELLQRL